MVSVVVKCPLCKSNEISRFGMTEQGKQRYQCQNSKCNKNTFILSYSRNGDLPEVKQKIIDMALNGSGIRDTARVLGVGINNTVIRELKKKRASKQ